MGVAGRRCASPPSSGAMGEKVVWRGGWRPLLGCTTVGVDVVADRPERGWAGLTDPSPPNWFQPVVMEGEFRPPRFQ